MTYLRDQSLEETREAFILCHVRQNPESSLRVLKVSVLDTSLDNVQRGGDDKRRRGTGDGGDEVLEPRRLVVVAETEKVFLGKRRATEKLYRIRPKPLASDADTHTAKEPGAFRAAVHPHPLYKPNPSSAMILKIPRPRNASGFVWRLILRTSSGNRTISPIPIRLHNVSDGFPSWHV